METPKLDFFLGKIREVKDRVTYEVTVDIPGIGEELTAYPYSRGEMDEPVAGNLVYLMSVDPMYHSVFLYMKDKENDFIGIRSNGKAVDITPDAITIGVYDTDKTHEDQEHPECTKSYVKMDSEGNIEIMATGNEEVKISGNANIVVSGSADINVTGNVKLHSDAQVTLSAPTLVGNNGTTSPQPTGPFCGIPMCLFTGAPHRGNTCSGGS